MFGIMDQLFPVFFIIIFSVVLIGFIMTFAKMGKEFVYNNSQPKLTVDAKVISKRTQVRGREHSHTYYHTTFEFEGGDRLELQVDGYEFGMMAEGDTGRLTFQGNRYIEFKRA